MNSKAVGTGVAFLIVGLATWGFEALFTGAASSFINGNKSAYDPNVLWFMQNFSYILILIGLILIVAGILAKGNSNR